MSGEIVSLVLSFFLTMQIYFNWHFFIFFPQVLTVLFMMVIEKLSLSLYLESQAFSFYFLILSCWGGGRERVFWWVYVSQPKPTHHSKFSVCAKHRNIAKQWGCMEYAILCWCLSLKWNNTHTVPIPDTTETIVKTHIIICCGFHYQAQSYFL